MDKSPMRKGDRKITTTRDLLRGLKKTLATSKNDEKIP